jgi:8-amino-7-oxononanoate synthase
VKPERLRAELATADAQGLRRRRVTVAGPQGPRLTIDGHEYRAFCSNDYLALANHPALRAAAHAAIERHGLGAGASHLVCGHSELHARLEDALAEFSGFERALLFSSGYAANLSVLSALAGRDSEIFADRLNHASLYDGALLARARLARYRHRDLDHLESLLARSRAADKFIVSDTVFSMDGDIAPLAALLALAERHDAWLYLDDAHGFGVLPPGTVMPHPRLIYMATLGKAAGVSGAFVAATADVIDVLVQRARPYIYTTAAPPLLAAAVLASLDLMRTEGDARRARLAALVARLRGGIASPRLLASTTPIQPFLLGSAQAALAAAARLRSAGLWVPAIRPPTVPEGRARLRISLSAAHTDADVDALRAALDDLG